jgi:hypothetical protein
MTVPAYSHMERRGTPVLYQPIGPASAAGFPDPDAEEGRLLFHRADEAGASGIYYPETLKSMRMAFDLAWTHVSSMFEDQQRARQTLAVQILHHVNRGEYSVGRLATSAADDLIALTSVSDRRSRNRRATASASINQTFAHYRAVRKV